jgi:hypothetical protein
MWEEGGRREGGRLDSGESKGLLSVDDAVSGRPAEAYEECGTCVDLGALAARAVTSAAEEDDDGTSFSLG